MCPVLREAFPTGRRSGTCSTRPSAEHPRPGRRSRKEPVPPDSTRDHSGGGVAGPERPPKRYARLGDPSRAYRLGGSGERANEPFGVRSGRPQRAVAVL